MEEVACRFTRNLLARAVGFIVEYRNEKRVYCHLVLLLNFGVVMLHDSENGSIF